MINISLFLFICLYGCTAIHDLTDIEAVEKAKKLPFALAVVEKWSFPGNSPGVYVSFKDVSGIPFRLNQKNGEQPLNIRNIFVANDNDILLLNGVHKLIAVNFGWRPYKPEALSAIGKLKSIETLFIWKGATDDEMPVIGKLNNIRRLVLKESMVSDAGIVHLVELYNLKELDLRWTKVTGSCLQHICNITSIETLNLGGVTVTDEQLLSLKKLPKLEKLFLDQTGVSESAIKQLMAISPNLALVCKDGESYIQNADLLEE